MSRRSEEEFRRQMFRFLKEQMRSGNSFSDRLKFHSACKRFRRELLKLLITNIKKLFK